MDKEREKARTAEERESGYSEKQSDVNAEIAAGEWETLRKFKTYQRRSRQWKIIATYQAINHRLNQLTTLFYKLVSTNPKASEKMLEEMRRLRFMQDFLAQCMVWEPKGQLKKEMVPKEIWELIE